MNARSYAATSSVIFFLVALLHLLRLVWHWNVMIDDWYVPAWVSVVGVVVAGFLSFAGFRLFRQGRRFSWLR
jgi:tellurite resistance protein TehA-like permease